MSADDEMQAIVDALREASDQPREPGRFSIAMGGEPRRYEWTGACPDCGRVLSARGISFGDFPCEMHPDIPECSTIHLHWSEDCPKHRLWRLWHHHTWGKAERRWKSWRWRRRAKRERADPAAWVEFWKQGGA